MKPALYQLIPFLSEDYQATVVLGTPNEIAVFRAGHRVAVIPLTVAELACLVRAVQVPQYLRPARDLHRALHLERLKHQP